MGSEAADVKSLSTSWVRLCSFVCCPPSVSKVGSSTLDASQLKEFLPPEAAALRYAKADRDLLDGWSAKASNRYTRLARQRVTAMQFAVSETFADRVNLDPLAESETLQILRDFMSGTGVLQFFDAHGSPAVLCKSWSSFSQKKS